MQRTKVIRRVGRGSAPCPPARTYFERAEGRACDVGEPHQYPAERVNWFDAARYANERGHAQGLPP